MAARTIEDDVAIALELLVQSGNQWNKDDVDRLLEPEPVTIPSIEAGTVELNQYDRLLEEFGHESA